MNDTKKKLFVLTGAGFSQAYLRYDNKELSTASINETLINAEIFSKNYLCFYSQKPTTSILNIQNLYKKVWEALQDKTIYSNQLYPPNFETVFYILNFLCQMNNPDKIINSTNEIHHTFFLPKLICSIKSEWVGYFSKEDFYKFKNFLLAYASMFTAKNEDLIKINNFITKLKENYCLRYYTLNYDNLFLKAVGIEFQQFSKFHVPGDINFGYDISTNNIVPSEVFSKNKEHCCFHLHGSVNYGNSSHTCTFHENEKDAFESRKGYPLEELNTGEIIDLSAFIIGYDKDKIMNLEPYSSFHLRMALDILEADEILILGYAMNDKHINKWLLKLTAPLVAPYYQCDEVKEYVMNSRLTKVEKITIVDKKPTESQKQQFNVRFKTIVRSSGERNLPSGYNELRGENIDNLEFYFDGVDSYISQYLAAARVQA
jgi:hypothetical protein